MFNREDDEALKLHDHYLQSAQVRLGEQNIGPKGALKLHTRLSIDANSGLWPGTETSPALNRTKGTNMKANGVEPRIQEMREARTRLRMTQFELSRRVGCSESQITKIETGRCQPQQWLREAIARELGINSFEVWN